MPEPRWLDERQQRAWRSVMTMQAALSEFIERQLRNKAGLSMADYEVLGHLSESPEGELRSFELARLLRWEKSRLSQHLGRMEIRHLASRERCATDQRGAVVIITQKGRSLITAAAPQHVADVRAALIDLLSAEELDLLTTVSNKVRARLENLEQKP